MIEITLKNFEQDLIAGSMHTPVLLDIWAEWCGPCKALGPVLEKLETEYDGRFQLAKVNADTEPEIAGQLSQMFGVRSIPFCVLFAGGQPVDGFVGALPESQIRAFLDKHVPSVDEMHAEQDVEAAEALLAQGDASSALEKLQEAIAVDPANDEARLDYIKALVGLGRLADARRAFDPVADKAQGPLADQRIAAYGLMVEACEAAASARDEASLQAAIAANKRDFAARADLARARIAAGRLTEAMDELLEIIMRDKTWNDGYARRLYVAVLEWLTKPVPKSAAKSAAKPSGPESPKLELTGRTQDTGSDPVIDQYRRKLSMALF